MASSAMLGLLLDALEQCLQYNERPLWGQRGCLFGHPLQRKNAYCRLQSLQIRSHSLSRHGVILRHVHEDGGRMGVRSFVLAPQAQPGWGDGHDLAANSLPSLQSKFQSQHCKPCSSCLAFEWLETSMSSVRFESSNGFAEKSSMAAHAPKG